MNVEGRSEIGEEEKEEDEKSGEPSGPARVFICLQSPKNEKSRQGSTYILKSVGFGLNPRQNAVTSPSSDLQSFTRNGIVITDAAE